MEIRGIEVLFGLERNWSRVNCVSEIIGVEITDSFGWQLGKKKSVNRKLDEYFQ